MIQLTDSTLEGLFDASPDAMLAINDVGSIVLANSESERLFGYSQSELIGLPSKTLANIMDPKFRPSATGLLMPGRRLDGSEFSASVSVSTISTDAGVLLSATIRDATERDEVEAELVRVKIEAERARLEAAADRVTAEGEKKVAERVRLEAEADRVTAEAEKREAERVRLDAEADRITAEAEKTVAERVRLEAEADRVTAEAEKREAERVRLDAEADRIIAEAEKTVAENVRLEAEVERVKAEGEKTVAEEVRLEAEVKRVKAEGEKTVAEGVRLEAEVERVKAEGEKTVAEEVRIEAEVERVKAEGEKTVAEEVRIEAVAEHQRLEAQLHQSQRMESLGQLAGGVAHDFNNLLAVIMNYASFVAEELFSAAADPAGEHWRGPLGDVEQIQLAAERGALLTHQLLSFARREVVQARPLSLNSAITRMEQILRRTIGEQIELVINLAEHLPMVVADPGQIEQIVLNLAINARDAMPDGGILTIDTSVREISAPDGIADVPAGPYVCFRVGDTGTGMSADVRDHAFEPFFTTKPRGEGSGLGLATVYGIVSQSGGFTRIYSDEGVGSSISILLPAAADEAEPAHGVENSGLAPRLVTETVLLVDDEEALREVTRRILTRNGYHVLTAANGQQAIEIATSHDGPIELLLTDVIMPAMQGPTVANAVRSLRPGIRVLFMSGHAHPVLEAEAVLGTEFLLLEKPFDQSMLLENIRQVLDHA
ncbi:MAG TPA: response regulator [Acidimicrobiales bacterium]|nr:response regulator [Acidimicrobiales bacterium]